MSVEEQVADPPGFERIASVEDQLARVNAELRQTGPGANYVMSPGPFPAIRPVGQDALISVLDDRCRSHTVSGGRSFASIATKLEDTLKTR